MMHLLPWTGCSWRQRPIAQLSSFCHSSMRLTQNKFKDRKIGPIRFINDGFIETADSNPRWITNSVHGRRICSFIFPVHQMFSWEQPSAVCLSFVKLGFSFFLYIYVFSMEIQDLSRALREKNKLWDTGKRWIDLPASATASLMDTAQ